MVMAGVAPSPVFGLALDVLAASGSGALTHKSKPLRFSDGYSTVFTNPKLHSQFCARDLEVYFS